MAEVHNLQSSLGDLEEEAIKFQKNGDYPKAIVVYERIIEERSKMAESTNESTELLRLKLADSYYKAGFFSKAQNVGENAMNSLKKILKKDDEKLIEGCLILGDILKESEQYSRALEYLNKASSLCQIHMFKTEIELIKSIYLTGEVYYYQKKFSQSRKLLEHALNILLQHYGEINEHVARIYNNLAAIDAELKTGNALEGYEKSLEIKKTIFEQTHPSIGIAYYNLAMETNYQGDAKKAVDYLKSAIEIYQLRGMNTQPWLAVSYLQKGIIESFTLNEKCRGMFDLQRALNIKCKDILIEKSTLYECLNSLIELCDDNRNPFLKRNFIQLRVFLQRHLKGIRGNTFNEYKNRLKSYSFVVYFYYIKFYFQ